MENNLRLCIDACEKLVDASQKLVDMCSVNDDEECAKQVGITAARCSNSIDACEAAIKHLRKLKEHADHEQAKKYEWAEAKCSDCIELCKKVREECKLGKVECLDKCVLLVDEASKTAQACNEALEASGN